MYVAVKGGEAAIDQAHQRLAEKRRGDLNVAELTTEQIKEQLSLAVDRVMTEGSLFDRDLAALALKQAMGDSVEAIFLLRAYRTTLPRFGYSQPLDTDNMQVERRISATYKDIPGGQALGPTFDYTHRLLDFSLLAEGETPLDIDSSTPGRIQEPTPETAQKITSEAAQATQDLSDSETHYPRVSDFLKQEGLLQQNGLSNSSEPKASESIDQDITREPLSFPCARSGRLQTLTRADEGFLVSLAYSTQRGYGRTHPFAGEIRMGYVTVELFVDELGFALPLGEICVTECDMLNQFAGNDEQPPQFTSGYGISFGFCERKTMAMALVDRSLQSAELGEATDTPAAHQEFVLAHCDNVEASGFVSHLKLPHYVDFQSELALVRKMREEYFAAQSTPDGAANSPSQQSPSQQSPSQQAQSTDEHVSSEPPASETLNG